MFSLFAHYLTTLKYLRFVASIGRLVGEKCTGGELFLRYYHFIFLKGLRKTAERSQDIRSFGRGMNPMLTACVSRAELLVTTVSVGLSCALCHCFSFLPKPLIENWNSGLRHREVPRHFFLPLTRAWNWWLQDIITTVLLLITSQKQL